VWFTQTLRMYFRRMDPDVPPEVDDGSQEDLQTGRIEGKDKEQDVHNLEERFFRYGVKTEWMQIHRIINHKCEFIIDNNSCAIEPFCTHRVHKNGMADYLIKWRELPYDQASWEADDYELPNYAEAITAYWEHRERMTGEPIPKSIAKKVKRSEGRVA